MSTQSFFTKNLLEWYQPENRPLPWKGIKNPYYIWLSEIILQQTRVEQGLPYYNKFIKKYPKINLLAEAPEDEVFKLWEGLGYYSRARNLHATAKVVNNEYKAVFPTSYADIRALKGIGDYTAAAIASFAYGLPHAVVDGNVYRVLSRFFGIATAIDTTRGKKEFRQLADSLLPKKQAALYNQAIMDFGATHCQPKNPKCTICPLQTKCMALANDKISDWPVKAKKLKKRDRYFYYLILNKGPKLLVHKRTEKDIWASLYDFPLIELDKQVEGLFLMDELKKTSVWEYWLKNQEFDVQAVSKIFKQTLSHQKINAIFIEINLKATFFREKDKCIAIESEKIKNFAFPKIIVNYLKEKTD
jgi:A/G-specific adenine glycosylase